MELAFNAQGINPQFGGSSGELWSDGSWNKVIITAERKQDNSKAGTGSHLGFTIKAIEGPDAGKEGYVAVNVWHTDAATRDRAAQQMAAICFATSVFAYTNTQALFNQPFWIENKHRIFEGAARNNFVGVRNINGVEPGQTNGSGGPQGGPAPQPQPTFGQQPQPQAGGPAPSFQPPANPQTTQPTFQAPAAPAGPSFGQPPAPAAPPAAAQGNWSPGGAPAAAPGAWQPGGAPPAAGAGPGWGAPQR